MPTIELLGEIQFLRGKLAEARAELARERKRGERWREALEFYGDEREYATWYMQSEDGVVTSHGGRVLADKGTVARAALAE